MNDQSRAVEDDRTLALILEDIFTATCRLRGRRRPVVDPKALRDNLREMFRSAHKEARARGYTEGQSQLALFAAAAFLDESILNSGEPALADWARKPLQEELFGVHIAGEKFFRNLEELLRQDDGPRAADVLEVHQLCLLLGFRGRYGQSRGADLRAITARVAERIGRIRARTPHAAPAWHLPARVAVAAADPWLRVLAWTATAMAILALGSFAAYGLRLRAGAADVRSLASAQDKQDPS